MLKKLVCAISAISIFMLTSCGIEKSKNEPDKMDNTDIPEVTGDFKTTVFSVGKADAIVLETKNHTVVIDTGEDDDGDEMVKYLSEHGIDSLDYLFITHFDQDHVGGAPEVIDNVSIGEIVTPDYVGNNTEYENFMSALAKNGIEERKLTENMTFVLDDVLFEVYPPQKSIYSEEDNDFSLVINVTHGNNTFMFAGDCETERLAELPDQMEMGHIFLKVPHHGEYCKGMDEFIESVDPIFAVITDSKKNPADTEVLEILEVNGCETYETINGDITVTSDGKKIVVTQ